MSALIVQLRHVVRSGPVLQSGVSDWAFFFQLSRVPLSEQQNMDGGTVI